MVRSKGGSARVGLDIGRDGAANTATMRLKRPYFLALAQPEMQENPEREGRGESATGGRLRKSIGRRSQPARVCHLQGRARIGEKPPLAAWCAVRRTQVSTSSGGRAQLLQREA